MYESLGSVILKTGETVELGVVHGPDDTWSPRIAHLLGHKGDLWRWQADAFTLSETGLAPRYWILHRDGKPFSNILTGEDGGIALLGHVFTVPEDRRKGATTLILDRLMADFHNRGKAMYLATTYATPPYHIYERAGFRGMAPGSGNMAYYAQPRERLMDEWFAPAQAIAEPLAWRHWASAQPLLVEAGWDGAGRPCDGASPTVIRCSPMGLVGHKLCEAPFLEWLRIAQREGERPSRRASLLRPVESSAAVGIAAWGPHPLWPGLALADLYCHPNFWDQAGALREAIQLPHDRSIVAYAEEECDAKIEALREWGFTVTGRIHSGVAICPVAPQGVDVVQLERKA